MKTALIIGGAKGIGGAVTRAFCAAGYRTLFSCFRSKEAAAALEKETGALSFACDLRKEEAFDSLIRYALAQLQHVDAAVVSAGEALTQMVQDTETGDFDRLMQVNLRPSFWLLNRLAAPMRLSGGGSVVLISSIHGLRGASCEAVYSAAKAGMIALAQGAAKELGPSGIRINALCPGVIDTDMMAGYTKDERQELIERTPLGRLGTPQDVAQAALFLCGDGAAFITGQTLTVDGGYL